MLLSALAYVGSDDPAQIEKAFNKVCRICARRMLPSVCCPAPNAAWSRWTRHSTALAEAAPQIKKNLIEACVEVVGADGVIQEREAELLRAIADTLDCPIPPFVHIE